MIGERRLGVMGGTFDPIHLGHLVIAQEAKHRLDLEKVLFVPCGVPPHKKSYEISAAEHRLQMTRLAIKDNPGFDVSRLELDRPGPSYTVDTIDALHQLHPASSLYFITGADAVLEILTWKEPERLVAQCVLVAATRLGYDLVSFRRRVGEALAQNIRLLLAPGVDVSSTEIRRRCAQGAPIRYLVTEAVRRYIEEMHLYL